FGTEGDACFLAFGSAAAALAAAAEAQVALAAADWPDGARPRVRMGVHTGSPVVVDDDYVGIDVHRAARICSAAHGGQVLVSGATRDAADPGPGQALRDLGHHRLKDLDRPEHLFQLVAAGLAEDFPPPRSLPTPSNLPAVPTSFVGREAELAEASELLARPGVRLLTLTGPGGAGKTRLALETGRALAPRFPDGVWSSSGPRPSVPTSPPTATAGRRRWPTSAAAWTGCPWPSSWPRPGCACSPWTTCAAASPSGCPC
ncbi:MAG TPA: adenylate/guanylate cyclase domain-containing protein, partial [Actinomycetes bacterium]|nr:adenylate/guanylate cyclase domain-containing protein [Actinomycetes bacterium]